MKPADEEKLRELAHSVIAGTGTGLGLEEMIIVAAGRRRLIRVVVDGDSGVSLDAAAEVSRALAAALDTDGDALLGEQPYTLEVTSPGVGRPLTEERHFRRARGRLVTIKMVDGSTTEGRVRRVVDGNVELLTGAGTASVQIPMAEIRRAKVDVEFAKIPPAHAALLADDGFVDPARAFDDVDAALVEVDEAEPDDDYYFGGELLDADDLNQEQDPYLHHSDREADDNDLEGSGPEPDADSQLGTPDPGTAREGTQ